MGNDGKDRRVRKTQKLLQDCLAELMKTKKVRDISVRELTEMADLNRGTFYLHYKDVFDLLEKTENGLIEELERLMYRPREADMAVRLSETLADIFHLVQENAGLVEILLGENGDLNFITRLKLLVREKCLQEWMEMFRPSNSDYFEAYYSFIVSGCIGLVQHWIQSGMPETPEELASLTEQIITKGIRVLENS